MSELNGVAKVLISLHKRGAIHLHPDFIADLEREMGYPERALDNAIDDILVPKPKIEIIGNYYKVYHKNYVYYIRNNVIPISNITVDYLELVQAMDYALVDIVIDMSQKIYVKNIYGIQQLTDAFFELP